MHTLKEARGSGHLDIFRIIYIIWPRQSTAHTYRRACEKGLGTIFSSSFHHCSSFRLVHARRPRLRYVTSSVRVELLLLLLLLLHRLRLWLLLRAPPLQERATRRGKTAHQATRFSCAQHQTHNRCVKPHAQRRTCLGTHEAHPDGKSASALPGEPQRPRTAGTHRQSKSLWLEVTHVMPRVRPRTGGTCSVISAHSSCTHSQG